MGHELDVKNRVILGFFVRQEFLLDSLVIGRSGRV